MNLTILHASDVGAKPRNATSRQPGGNERPTVRMAILRERRRQMRSMRHTRPGERVLEVLALLLNSHCHMDHIRWPRDPCLLHHFWTDTIYTGSILSTKTLHTLRPESWEKSKMTRIRKCLMRLLQHSSRALSTYPATHCICSSKLLVRANTCNVEIQQA